MAAEDYRIEEGFYYTKEHMWVKVENGNAVIGITDYGQHQLGDIVFVELPSVNQEVESGEKVVSIESVKAAIDLFSPLSGKIVSVNEDLKDDPSLLNTDPYGEGWIYEMEMGDTDELEDLMTSEDYRAYIQEIEAEEE
ncbi:glycine cleavage system protein GcvH [Persephonella sp.]